MCRTERTKEKVVNSERWCWSCWLIDSRLQVRNMVLIRKPEALLLFWSTACVDGNLVVLSCILLALLAATEGVIATWENRLWPSSLHYFRNWRASWFRFIEAMPLRITPQHRRRVCRRPTKQSIRNERKKGSCSASLLPKASRYLFASIEASKRTQLAGLACV